jgi:UPF0755 protein
MSDRRDEWFADEEGNLIAPDDSPTTDEFGRDDPAAIERERRRLEREQRRRGSGRSAPKEARGETGGFSRLLGRGRAKRTDDLEAEPPPRPAEPPRRTQPPPPAEPQQPRESRLRKRLRRGGGDGGGERRPAGRGKYRRRRVIALAAALVGVLLLWFLVALFQPFKGDGNGEGEVIVSIPDGASAGDVADILTDNDVVSSGSLFQLRLRLAGKSDSVGAGRFVLARDMSYGTAIERLTNTGGKVTLTLPEGPPRDENAGIVADAGLKGDYLAESETAPKGFDPAQYAAPNRNLEGFLFPATYELDPGAPVQELIDQQLEAFEQNFAGVDLSYAKRKKLTPYDVLIIASMVDREVLVPKERPLVAAVIYNRLSRGIPLQIDATTRYLFKNYDQPLTKEQLASTNPYNTRVVAGLPPGPIGNPGLASIKAAARPANVDYLYYVVKPGTCGEHNFTASEAEFEKFAAEYQQALEAAGGSPTEC